MTAVTHDEVVHEESHEHVSHDRTYVKTALVLAVITAIETATYFFKDFPLWSWGEGVGITIFLLVMMTLKFVGVVSIFMHLKYDSKILSWCFYAGLFLALFVYLGVMAVFRLFWDGSHMLPG